MLLLMHLWDTGGEMRESKALIVTVTRIRDGQYRTVWPKIRGFFKLENGMIRHKRIDSEIQKRADFVQELGKRGAKGGKKTQQKQRRLKADAQAYQTKGLVSSPYGEEKPNLPRDQKMEDQKPSAPTAADSALSPLSGQGLSADAAAILREIRLQASKRPHVSLADMDLIKAHITGFDGKTFTISKKPSNPKAFSDIQSEAEAQGYEIHCPAPVLHLVSEAQS